MEMRCRFENCGILVNSPLTAFKMSITMVSALTELIFWLNWIHPNPSNQHSYAKPQNWIAMQQCFKFHNSSFFAIAIEMWAWKLKHCKKKQARKPLPIKQMHIVISEFLRFITAINQSIFIYSWNRSDICNKTIFLNQLYFWMHEH